MTTHVRVGLVAHYVAYNGRHLAAIITGYNGETGEADLAVLTNMLNVVGKKNGGLQFHFDVRYATAPEPGTWHYLGECQVPD